MSNKKSNEDFVFLCGIFCVMIVVVSLMILLVHKPAIEKIHTLDIVHSNSLRTGDILLFSSKSAPSLVFKWMNRTYITHVGMVFIMPTNGLPYVFEIDPFARKTPILTPLCVRVKKYVGNVYTRQIFGPPVDIHKLVEKIDQDFTHSTYSFSCLEDWGKQMLGPAFLMNDSKLSQDNKKAVYCTTLISNMLSYLGIFQKSILNTPYLPKDFIKTDLPTTKKYHFGKFKKLQCAHMRRKVRFDCF